MRDVAYHMQEGKHVLLVLTNGPCRLVLEIRLDVRREMLKYQVLRPGSVLDPCVLILIVLLLCDHEHIQVEFNTRRCPQD